MYKEKVKDNLSVITLTNDLFSIKGNNNDTSYNSYSRTPVCPKCFSRIIERCLKISNPLGKNIDEDKKLMLNCSVDRRILRFHQCINCGYTDFYMSTDM